MGGGNKLWTVSYFGNNGQREHRTTPYLPHKGAAVAWILRLRPLLMYRLDEVEVRPWRRGDPR